MPVSVSVSLFLVLSFVAVTPERRRGEGPDLRPEGLVPHWPRLARVVTGPTRPGNTPCKEGAPRWLTG